jgi:hypothetical protein
MTLDVHAETPSTPPSPSAAAAPFALPRRRILLAAPLVTLVTMAAALLATGEAGVPLRDPDDVTGNRLLMAVSLILALFAIDMAVRAWRRTEGR